jgi:biotin synthase
MVAGANSIFYGEALLTTPNVAETQDDALFSALAPRTDAARID